MLVKATVLFVILLSIQHSLSKKIPPAIFNGWHGVSVDDPDVQNLAEEAVKIYSEQEKKEYKLQGVMSVQQQLVIGVNYKMDLYANRSLGPGHSLHIPLHDDVFVDAQGIVRFHLRSEKKFNDLAVVLRWSLQSTTFRTLAT
ncbi:unnamed protein product [Bursaphelenchus xylophilus]|uniref:(pine wood nematode) hypothetical protein n=1 Tax=Bursaphelenchus xylophilus TaxID=6326 RepID=A0A1I7SQI9_BURXY|nr:unnamed protein product [Bursaphelenchus xylophilus]CAG9109962.1 unnamed protein product [Bursaphelenchus xylophilus]